MEFNKENRKKIMGIVFSGIILYWGLQNIALIKNGLANVLEILSPFLIGAGLAFVLNIPMSGLEKRLFKPKKMKNGKIRQHRLKRPICIVLAIIIVLLVISFVIKLVIPQLISVVFMFIREIPALAYDMKEWAIELTKQYPDISNQIQNMEMDWNRDRKSVV